MTAGLMGAPPDGAVDPLAPEHVAPLVVYLAGPAAAGINGEVFVVHGGVAAVMDPPRIRAVFLAADHGSADGMWTPGIGAPGPGSGVHRGAARDRLPLRGHAGPGHRDHRVHRPRPGFPRPGFPRHGGRRMSGPGG